MRERAAEQETRNQKTGRAGQTGIGIWKTAAGQKNDREIKKNAAPEHKSLQKGDGSKRKTGTRGEEKQGKEIVSNYGGLFEGGGKYDTIGIWKEK